MSETMKESRRAAGDDPLVQFAASGEAYLDFALGYPTYYRVMFSGDLLNSKGHESLQHTSAESFRQITEDLVKCQELGVVRKGDPQLQAISIISTVHGYVSLVNDNRIGHLSADKYNKDEVKDFVISTIFEGIGVE